MNTLNYALQIMLKNSTGDLKEESIAIATRLLKQEDPEMSDVDARRQAAVLFDLYRQD